METIWAVSNGNVEGNAAIFHMAYEEAIECAVKLGFRIGPTLLDELRHEASWWERHVGFNISPCTPELARALSVDVLAVLIDATRFSAGAGANYELHVKECVDMIDAYVEALRDAAAKATRTAPDMNCACH